MEEVIFRTLLQERIERLEGRVAALAEHFGVSFVDGRPTVVKNEAAQ